MFFFSRRNYYSTLVFFFFFFFSPRKTVHSAESFWSINIRGNVIEFTMLIILREYVFH